MFRKALVLVALVGAVLVAPAAAKAGTWQWYGWVTPSQPADADCIWYYGQSACSGWNYWYASSAFRTGAYAGGTLHTGFQNNDRIRGVIWDGSDGTIGLGITASSVGMGGYLKAHTMYWSGVGTYLDPASATT